MWFGLIDKCHGISYYISSTSYFLKGYYYD